MRSLVPAALALAALAGCSHAPTSTACNGHDELCARAYDQVAFPGTHNAYSNTDENFGAPDQTHTMTRQLDDGVRVLHLELQAFDGDVSLCHSICPIGQKLLVDGFTEIGKWVDDHPRDVVTLLMESNNVAPDDVVARLKKSGLYDRLHTQPPGAPWPTLGELVAHGDRVVAFLANMTQTGGPVTAPLIDRFTATWETPWDNEKAADFVRCDADRGVMGAPIYVVDTYLEDQVIPTVQHAELVNFNPFLIERLEHCAAAEAKLPNFVMVNYYEVGDLFADVDVLNGFGAPPDADADAFAPAFDGPSPATD